jgi:hypothetical protein
MANTQVKSGGVWRAGIAVATRGQSADPKRLAGVDHAASTTILTSTKCMYGGGRASDVQGCWWDNGS